MWYRLHNQNLIFKTIRDAYICPPCTNDRFDLECSYDVVGQVHQFLWSGCGHGAQTKVNQRNLATVLQKLLELRINRPFWCSGNEYKVSKEEIRWPIRRNPLGRNEYFMESTHEQEFLLLDDAHEAPPSRHGIQPQTCSKGIDIWSLLHPKCPVQKVVGQQIQPAKPIGFHYEGIWKLGCREQRSVHHWDPWYPELLGHTICFVEAKRSRHDHLHIFGGLHPVIQCLIVPSLLSTFCLLWLSKFCLKCCTQPMAHQH